MCISVGRKGTVSKKDLDPTVEWTKFALYCADKCRKFKLSREVRTISINLSIVSVSVTKGNNTYYFLCIFISLFTAL